MMQVKDLRLREEVLHSFDYTNSEQAALCLLCLLQEIPSTENEVLERQGIIKGIINNWSVLENFSYKRLDLRETHDFFENITSNSALHVKGKIKASLKLMFNDTDRNQLKSKLVQAVLLLRRINVQYLSRIDRGAFPAGFQVQLQHAFSFLNKLDLDTTSEHINEDRLTITRIVELTHRLEALDPSEVKAFWHFFFTFEAFWSIAKGTITNGLIFPTFDTTAFSIEDFYHPSIKNPVKNTLRMEMEQNVLLLTGPNMSGKSTLLKALGLCVYLARAGFTVPATVCTVPFFNSIAVAVNLYDSLEGGYSHFMAEIKNLKSIIQAAEGEGKCFAVFDEIFKGTNVDDALHLIQVTVDGLTKRKGSFFFISTHMLQLDEQLNPEKSKEVKKCYIECVLDKESPKFSYRLKEGWSQLKIGKILFQKEGLTELLESRKEEW